jgi:hypothetical protein
MKFTSQRVATPAEIANLPLTEAEFRKNTVWVDTDASGSWGVYRKNINYTLENQVTKASSQSLGSAVAISSQLGYVISDADLGQVYRYTFNDLNNAYELVQTLVGNPTFGSTISYAGDLYAIAETTGAASSVKLYQLQSTTTSDDLVLVQTIPYAAALDDLWGTAISISKNQNWIYISDIDNNTVHVYQRSNIVTTAGNFESTETYIINSIGTTDFTSIGATSNDVGTVFIATGVGTGTGVATKITFNAVTTIDGDALTPVINLDIQSLQNMIAIK